MGEVFFRCPKTGKEFESGFQASPSELRFLPPNAGINLRCKVCSSRREFKFAAARVAAAGMREGWQR